MQLDELTEKPRRKLDILNWNHMAVFKWAYYIPVGREMRKI